jgi:RimJ/RimL family protein N-acetyltransferase
VIAYTHTGNEASQAVMHKLGMTYEAEFEHAGLPHVLHRLARVT